MNCIRTTSENKDFQNLVELLDQYLAGVDGENHDFYHQFNGISMLNHCLLIFENGSPVACGAIKEYDKNTVEIKRMFTLTEHRGKGLASTLLKELEVWAKELSYKTAILETGKKQEDAVALYQKNQYQIIPNFGQYADIEDSVCFEKTL